MREYDDWMIDNVAAAQELGEWRPDDDDDPADHDPAAERQAAYLDEQDAADLWTPESVYDGRAFWLYWRGMMTYDELQERRACIEAKRREYMAWVNERTARIMAEMGW